MGQELEASGAEAAEGQVRGILAGLGFTDAMAEGSSAILSGGWRMRVVNIMYVCCARAFVLLFKKIVCAYTHSSFRR